MNAKPALIDIHNATVYRGDTCVFDGLSISIQQGESVAILGPNGAGKTTFLRLLSRQIRPVLAPDSWVKILGHERFSVWDYRRHLGVVSSDVEAEYLHTCTGLNCVLTGYSASLSIDSPLFNITSQQKQSAEAVMARLQIAHLAPKTLAHMSTGEVRRCLLARALVHQPKTLIFDEPTAGMDFSGAANYMRLVRELLQRGTSVIVVTHHINDIPPEVQRVVLIKQGRVVADGDKATILTSKHLSQLYDTGVNVVQNEGYFVALPKA